MTLFNLLFGCKHKRLTFPQTTKRNARMRRLNKDYIVCTDCGKEFPYDWFDMRIGARLAEVSRKPEQKAVAQVINIDEPRKVRVK